MFFLHSQCAARIKDAFSTVDAMLKSGKNAQLSTDFNLCSVPTEEADVYNFVSNLADVFMGAAQYNNQIHPNITELCNVMTDSSRSSYENLRHVLSVRRR